MSKELEALKYLKENKRKHWLSDDRSQECLDTIEAALSKCEQYKAFEEESGIDLLLLIRLVKYLDKVYKYEIDEPFYVKDMLSGEANPITPVYLSLDLKNKKLVESYNANEPWETEYLFSEYGTTWALTKEELI